MTATALSWMLTYLLHSTLLMGGAWLGSRLLAREALAVREALWRVALLGALATATFQVGLGVEPRLGGWRLAAGEAIAVAPLDGAAASDRLSSAGAAAVVAAEEVTPPRRAARAGAVPAASRAAADTGGAKPVERATAAAPRAWGRAALALWALGALVLTVRLALALVALARRLADRRPIAGGGLHALLARLLAAARMCGVRLSATPRIASPLALGWRKPEICLPERVASEMSAEQQELILAHELAHHARHDPLWLIVARLIESVLFFQPLNRLARRRLQEIAEYRCDDWAVERTGRPITLARCLADVAEWSLRRGAALPVPTLAVERRRLGRRVARLLDRSYPYPAPRRPRWLAAGVAVTLAAVVLLAPGVSSGHGTPAPQTPQTTQAAPGAKNPGSEAPPSPEAPAPPPDLAGSPAPAPPPATAASSGSAPAAPRAPRAELPSPALAAAPRPAPGAGALAAPTPPAAPRLRASAAPVVPAPPPAPLPPARRLEGSAPMPPAPARPAPPPGDGTPAADNGGWVLHDASRPWPTLAPVPVARLAGSEDQARAAEPMADSAALAALAESSAVSSERLAELSRRLAEATGPDPATLERVARLSAELAARTRIDPELTARIAALSHELAARGLADDRTRALFEDYARRAAAAAELGEEERAELARLRAEIERERARWLATGREEVARLGDEIRRQVEASRPDREEIARLHAEIRRELEAARPELEEMARWREQMRRELEASRPDREEMRRAHEEALRELAQQLEERDRSRAREERWLREVEELRAELERLRDELRRERAGGDRF